MLNSKNPWSLRLKLTILQSFVLLSVSTLATSCAHRKLGRPLESLCILDFDKKMCWVDEKAGVGVSFADMDKNQKACKEDPIEICWFAMDSWDLTRMHQKLNSQDEEK